MEDRSLLNELLEDPQLETILKTRGRRFSVSLPKTEIIALIQQLSSQGINRMQIAKKLKISYVAVLKYAPKPQRQTFFCEYCGKPITEDYCKLPLHFHAECKLKKHKVRQWINRHKHQGSISFFDLFDYMSKL